MASIYKSRDRWVAQVNLSGKRRSRSFDHKRDAQRWARQEEAAQDSTGTVRSALSDVVFNDLIEAYLEEFGTGSSKSKLGAITHISEILGRVPLPDLTVSRFREFVAQRRAEGAGPATVGLDMSFIHTILKHGGAMAEVDIGSTLGNYTAARAILSVSGAVSRPQERKRRPTDAELITLRDYWAGRRRVTPMWELTQFAVCTAMRLSEITRIRWDDLDVEARTVMIRDRKHPRSKKGNNQTVPLLCGPVVIAGQQVDPLALILDQRRDDARIWPYDPATVSTGFTRAVSACGIADLRFHDLRHDGVSRLFEDGYDIPRVALVSGHQDWQMLRRYTQMSNVSANGTV